MVRTQKVYFTLFILVGIVVIVLILFTQVMQRSQLSELQMVACNAAHEGNTCDTKLVGLGFVTKEQCCQSLGKCC